MQRLHRRLWIAVVAMGCLTQAAHGQKVMSWQEVRDEFKRSNPTLRAGRIGIDESRAQEITAYLRPNPDLTFTLDQINPFTDNPIRKYSPFAQALPFVSGSYLHERRHKR